MTKKRLSKIRKTKEHAYKENMKLFQSNQNANTLKVALRYQELVEICELAMYSLKYLEGGKDDGSGQGIEAGD